MTRSLPATTDRARRAPQPGTARAALAHREFKIMWMGSFATNIGSWMQQVAQGAFAYELTKSASFVGLLVFAQLGPLLLLGLVGGLLADAVDRRKFLLAIQVQQLASSAVLAVLAVGNPSRWALVLVVTSVGVGNALKAPAWSSALPFLVGREDLPGAISLNSTMVNGSRVVGPMISGALYPVMGAAGVFTISAAMHGFVIFSLLSIRLPPIPKPAPGESQWRKLTAGFRLARRDPLVRRVLVTINVFSVVCLPFIGQFPVVAERNFGIDSESFAYGVLYGIFGLGACLGALSVGTVLAQADKRRVARVGMVGFGVALAVFGSMQALAPAYPAAFVLGLPYFMTTTALLTVLQANVDDDIRGRIMAMWFMGFGGMVSIGNLIAGPVIDATNPTVVLLFGAAAALVLAWWCDLVEVTEPSVAADALAGAAEPA